MGKELSNLIQGKRIEIFVLVGFCIALYFVNLGQWDLWNPDEPRYAEVAREMVTGGDWILMHYNGNVYSDKPPLFFWLIGLLSFLWQGFTSFAVRFPAAFFGMSTVLLTYYLGKSLFNSFTGFISGLVLATSFEFAFLSTRGNIDSTLTFFTTASLFCFIAWEKSRQEREDQGANSKLLVGFYVGMVFATLAKGPIGFVLPLLVSVIYLILQKDWKAIKGMKLLPGIVLVLGLVLAWYVPAVLRGGKAYLDETLFLQSLGRFSQGWAKGQPIYYYLYTFPISFFPWVIFLPAVFIHGGFRGTLQRKREYLFPVVWFAAIFFFFSLSKGKRALYLLPLFPAVAILVGKLWHDLIFTSGDPARRRWVSVPLHALIGVSLVGGVAIPWVVYLKFPFYFLFSLPIACLMIGGGLALWFLYRSGHHGIVLALVVGMVAGGFFYAQRIIFPLVNPFKSARFMSQEITSRISTGDKVCVYGRVSTSAYNFYTGIVPIWDFSSPEDLFRFLRSQERVFCLLRFEDFSQFQTSQESPRMQLVARHQVGHRDIVLVSNR